jgi:hypothetical protein
MTTETTTESTSEAKTKALPAPTPQARPPRDPVAAFGALPWEEKLLAGAAFAVLLGFLVSNSWHLLFRERWFETCALLGSVAVLAVLGLQLFGYKVAEPGMRPWLLALLACIPGAGWLFDALRNFWTALIFAGSVTLAYAAWCVVSKEPR